MTEREKMTSGLMYNASDPDLLKARDIARKICIEAETVVDDNIRTKMFSQIIKIKGNANFGLGLKLDYGFNVDVGDNFYCNHDCIFLDVAPIKIGDNCMFGPLVQLYTATHPLDAKTRNSGLEFGNPITIGDNVWIGGGAIVFPGVTIGDNVVVSGGSVVTKSVPNNTLVGGNPAVVLKENL